MLCKVVLHYLHAYHVHDHFFQEVLRLIGAHLMPPGERFITWDLPVEILVGVA